MNTAFWTTYISDSMVKAICWTLIHSLWIGMIIALLTGLVITLTRKSGPNLRYSMLCGILLLFVISVSVTYLVEIKSAGEGHVYNGTRAVFINHANIMTVNHAVQAVRLTLFARSIDLLNQNTNIIFVLWLLFFMLKSLKMVSGLLYIQRIRSYKVHDIGEEFKHKAEVFSRQIGIRQTVHLAQSELVKVPVAVGWLKPLVLLPVGIILQLSTEQLDSILWHELAHIRRRDYLVNILQGLVETVFFFNPGLLWLSSLIRAEREACCDDMVLSRTNRKANYLEALLAFGYEDNSRTALVMSIGGGNQLRDRMQRMVSQENKRLSVAEKVVLIAGLVLLSAFTALPKNSHVVVYLSRLMAKKPVVSVIVKPVVIKPIVKEPVLYDKRQELVKDTTIKKTDTDVNFTSVLFKQSDADLANNDINAMDDKGNHYHFIIVNGKLVAMDINDVKVSENELSRYAYMVRYIDLLVAEKRRVRDEDIARFKASRPAVKFKYSDSLDFAKQKFFYREDAFKQGPVDRAAKLNSIKKRFRVDSTDFVAQQQRARNVIADLIADKVAPDAASVKWFGLSNSTFIVNGQKQPEEMQQRYKAKYGIRENYGLYYGPVQMHGTGVFIDGPGRPSWPSGPDGPGPKLKDVTGPLFRDTTAWKTRQLIRQERLFTDEQTDQRAQLVRQQQLFAAVQDEKRKQLLKQQRIFAADQARRIRQLEQQNRTTEAQRWKARWNQTIDSKVTLPDVVASIAGDLVSENIVKDKSDLRWFSLTNSALIVNGKVQPDEAHQKLKDKYLHYGQYPLNKQVTQDPNFGLHYNLKTGGMGLGIKNGPDDN